MLLSIDSSAGASAALIHDGAILASSRTRQTNTHAEWLAPAVQDSMEEAGVLGDSLEGVVVGVGPGPFTGLRVGLALAHSLAEAWGKPLYGICSLDGLAFHAASAGMVTDEFLVVTDARRREIYWARYGIGDGSAVLISGPHVGPASQVPKLDAVGPALSLYPEHLTAVREPEDDEPPEHIPYAEEARALEGGVTPLGDVRAEEMLPDAADLGLLAERTLHALGVWAEITDETGIHHDESRDMRPNTAELVPTAELASTAGLVSTRGPGSARSTVLRSPYPLYLRESDAKIPQQMRVPQQKRAATS